jgi:hypothetical protein
VFALLLAPLDLLPLGLWLVLWVDELLLLPLEALLVLLLPRLPLPPREPPPPRPAASAKLSKRATAATIATSPAKSRIVMVIPLLIAAFVLLGWPDLTGLVHVENAANVPLAKPARDQESQTFWC